MGKCKAKNEPPLILKTITFFIGVTNKVKIDFCISSKRKVQNVDLDLVQKQRFYIK